MILTKEKRDRTPQIGLREPHIGDLRPVSRKWGQLPWI